MRVLFYTAAAIAATIATLGEAVKINNGESVVIANSDTYIRENSFSQIDAF